MDVLESIATVKQRYLRPTSKGVFNWLGKSEQSLERRLFETLVIQGKETPFELRTIAKKMAVPPTELARALFSLNRSESLSLLENGPSKHGKGWASEGMAELSEMLALIADPGQKIVLSSHDGFQLARVGYGLYEADVLSVQHSKAISEASAVPYVAALHIGGRWFILSASSSIDKGKQKWLDLAYLLLSFANFNVNTDKEGA